MSVKIILLLAAICESPDPNVNDCHVIFAMPARSSTMESCAGEAMAAARYFRGTPERPYAYLRCVDNEERGS